MVKTLTRMAWGGGAFMLDGRARSYTHILLACKRKGKRAFGRARKMWLDNIKIYLQ
jgi:hypothetical protein